MAWDMPTEGVEPDKLGGFAPKPSKGIYLGNVIFVDEEDPKTSKMIADLEVFGGRPAEGALDDQIGRQIRAFFENPRDAATPEKRIQYARKAYVFALATELITEEQLQAAVNDGKPMSIRFKLAEGRKLIFEVEESRAKDGVGVAWQMWPLTAAKEKGLVIPGGAQVLGAKDDPFTNPPGDGQTGKDPFAGVTF